MKYWITKNYLFYLYIKPSQEQLIGHKLENLALNS